MKSTRLEDTVMKTCWWNVATSCRTVRAQRHFSVRAQSTKETIWRVESKREGASNTNDKSAVSARFYCLSRTVRAGGGRSAPWWVQTVCIADRTVQFLMLRTVRGPWADGPRPDTQFSNVCPLSDFEFQIRIGAHKWTFRPIQELVCMHIHIM